MSATLTSPPIKAKRNPISAARVAEKCGAKTRAGGACKAPAMKNGRCRVHGGKSTGPKIDGARPGNRNALKHGIYSRRVHPSEEHFFASVSVGNIDDELRVARIVLRRLMRAQTRHQGRLELDLVRSAPGEPTQEVYRNRDRFDIIQKLLGRIGGLELARAELMAIKRGGHDDTEAPPRVNVRIDRTSNVSPPTGETFPSATHHSTGI